MLWHMLSRPGSDLSPAACPALIRRRAISSLTQPRFSRCSRSQGPSSPGICFLPCKTACLGFQVSAMCRSRDQAVGEAGFGAGDEGADLVGFEDERGTCGVGGLTQGDAAAGELLGFEAVAAVGPAPWLDPAFG